MLRIAITQVARQRNWTSCIRGRSQIPPDVQSPVHVVKQIRDAHKQLLALSRNNFAKTPNEPDLFPQSESPGRNGWHIDSDSQHEQRSLGSISELSDTTHQHKPSPLGMYHPVEQSRDTVRELQQQVDRLSRELVTLNHERDRQQHEHFKLRQEQQLHFDDLRQHASTLESQLQDSQSSTEELLSVNNFLDAELTKHKGWLDSSQQTASHYRHLFKQEEHQKEQLAQQLHDTQAQLAETWRESSHMQELVAELKGQTAAAADHQAHVRDLTEANRKLDVSSGHLQEANGELLETNRHLEELNKDLIFQLEGLRQVEQSKHELHDVHASHQAQRAEQESNRVAELQEKNTQLEGELAALHRRMQQAEQNLEQSRQIETQAASLQAHNASLQEECSAKGSQVRQLLKLQEQFETSEAARQAQHVGNAGIIADLTATNNQLEGHVSALNRQLEKAQSKRHQAEESTAAQHAQQAAVDAANTDDITNLTEVNVQLMEQMASLNKQLEQAQADAQQAFEAASAQRSQQAYMHSETSQALTEQAEFDSLQQECKAKDLKVQQLLAELSTHPEASGGLQHTQQSSANSEQTLHLTNVNKQLEDSVADLDLQLEQAQQEIDSCHAQIDQLTRSLAAQRAQHDDHIVEQARGGGAQAEQAQAELALVQEDCTAKALQVQQLLTQVDQLTDDRDYFDKQIQHLRDQVNYLSEDRDEKDAQMEQMSGQLEALQQEHHRLTATCQDQEQQNRLLQDDCAQLQTYISALDEDLGKAQARMDIILGADNSSAAKQNELLKAAAKQVIQIQARDAKRSRVPKLLRKFSTRKKERGFSSTEEPAVPGVPESATQMHPLSPRATSQFSPRPGVSRTTSGITTASHNAGMIGTAVPEHDGLSGGASGPITPEQMPSVVVASDASVDYGRLKAENSTLSQKLAQANKDMAELNSRLVDAAFGNAFAASLSDNITPSASGLDREDSSNQFDRDSNNHLDRDSSNPAASSSGEQNSIMGLPPGVPLDLFYDE
ncbi:hypothetical protein WJX82_007406 [Trebouxia sp. C0006]